MEQWKEIEMKYRRKPMVVEVTKFNGSSTDISRIEKWVRTGELRESTLSTRDLRTFKLMTWKGEITVSPGDYVIKVIGDQFYPSVGDDFSVCSPEEFEEMYELYTDEYQ